MIRLIARSAAVVLAIAAGGGALAAAAAEAASWNAVVVNRGVVELETGPAEDISVRMAGEIASIVDDGATRRVVPVVGKGPLENLVDLQYLRGIDLAIVQSDAIDYARQQNFLPALSSLTYVTKLYNEEFHLLARSEIKEIGQLAGAIVNVGAKEGGSAVTATRLFGFLNINARVANDNQAVALRKLRDGEIAAIAFVVAKPAPFFESLHAAHGLHLLSIPLTQPVMAAYAPTRITSADYPKLVAADHPVDTIAVASILMAADLHMAPDRDRNVANFVDAFFTGFQGLLAPGYDEKWREVNIAADVPELTRNPAAKRWLVSNPQVAAVPNPAALRALFSRFIEERQQASGSAPMSAAARDALFQQFLSWQRDQAR
jgi:uncharacterized protein